MIANLFYTYGVIEILNIIYHLRNYLIEYKNNPNDLQEDVVIDITNPMEYMSKVDVFGFIMSVLSFIWLVIGLFTINSISFLTLIILTFGFMFYKKPNVKTSKNIFIITSTLKICIVLFIIYNHFINHT